MPFSPPLVLEARSGTKFQLLLPFNIVGPFLGLTRNLGARHKLTMVKLNMVKLIIAKFTMVQVLMSKLTIIKLTLCGKINNDLTDYCLMNHNS